MKRKIAVVGFAFRFPATSTDTYWDDLLSGKDLVGQVDPARWTREAFYHPDHAQPGASYTFAAGSIGDIASFDAAFFRISPREAAQMDPQQRLLLELTWEAFENAGVRPSSVRGGKVGVYVGIATSDYAVCFAEELAAVDTSAATGTAGSIAANRISYMFDLKGPSMSIDTACSSSLVAFHQACQSIASGEITQAIVGGINLHVHPYNFVAFSKAGMLSERGRCSPFDAAGDGYTRAEGGGVFILKDYDLALADGNPVLAVVAGSAVNSDGRKSGLAVPSADAQGALLDEAYARAGIDPALVDYVEAHGTGTAVGDPVEARALGKALGQRRSLAHPLLIGSVKSNMGHLEAAAGIAGLVKAMYCIRHRVVPPTIHFETPNPAIEFDDLNLRVVNQATQLDACKQLVIGVNSFGFGGTNAHVVLESHDEAMTEGRATPRVYPARALPLLLSGKTPAALTAMAARFVRHLRGRIDDDFYDIAFNAAFNRDLHEYRAVVFATRPAEAADRLEDFSGEDVAAAGVETGTALGASVPLAFVYSGNGSQWEGMGRVLLAEDPVFAAAVRAVDTIFARYADFSLVDELAGKNGSGRFRRTEIAQPALFALQVGVTEMLRVRGVRPAAVVGHSVGEVAAAWASGALTLEQAVAVVYHRSALQGVTRGRGTMTAVAASQESARTLLSEAGLIDSVAIAGINSPRGVTFAGEESALVAAEAALARGAIPFKRLDLDYAFHSRAMDEIESALAQALNGLKPSDTRIPFVSTVDGSLVSGTRLDARYWWHNIRDPIRFESAINNLLAGGTSLFVEIGPHAVLRGYIAEILGAGETPGRCIPTVMRGHDSPGRIAAAAAQVMIAGGAMDWQALFHYRGRFVDVPTYAWQRESYWIAPQPDSPDRLHRPKLHPLLGFQANPREPAWENRVDARLNPTMADHVVGDTNVLPGTAFVEMALAAATCLQAGAVVELEEMEIRSPLVLDGEVSKSIRVEVDPADGSFSMRARDVHGDAPWTMHAVGRIAREHGVRAARLPKASMPAGRPDFDAARHDELTRTVGLRYGPAFRAVEAGWVDGDTAWARLHLPEAVHAEIGRYSLHPALLDCTFQILVHLEGLKARRGGGFAYVTASIGRLIYFRDAGVPRFSRATLVKSLPHSLTANFSLFDADGQTIAILSEVRFQAVRLSKDPVDKLRLLGYHAIAKPLPRASHFEVPGLYDGLRGALAAAARACAAHSQQRAYFGSLEPLLDALCSDFALQALRGRFPEGDFIAGTILENHDGGAKSPALDYMISLLQQDGLLTVDAGGFRFSEQKDFPAPQDIWNTLIADHPGYLPVIHAVGQFGLHLRDVLSGSADAAHSTPRACTPAALSRFVLGAAAHAEIGRTLVQVVQDGIGRLTEGQRFRIIEISDGALNFAGSLCNTIDPDRCDYTLVGTSILASDDWLRLKERFPGIRFAQLDAIARESDAPSGHELYQLAIVSSGFGGGESAIGAIEYATQVLAAGAALIHVVVPTSRWADFVFGATGSWWNALAREGRDLREQPGAVLQQRLVALGHASVVRIDLEPGAPSSASILVARRGDRAIESDIAPLPARGTWVLLADQTPYASELSARLARRLEAEGRRVVQAIQGTWEPSRRQGVRYVLNLTDVDLFAELLVEAAGAAGEIEGIVHLCGLGGLAEEAGAAAMLGRQVDRLAVAAAASRALERTQTATTLWLITAGAKTELLPRRRPVFSDVLDAPLWGFGRTLQNEAMGFSVRLVDLERVRSPEISANALAQELLAADDEQEVLLTASWERFVPRLRTLPRFTGSRRRTAGERESLRLGFQAAGQLRNLHWETWSPGPLGMGEIEIDVRATGLNFRDVMYALGMLSDEAVAGGFAGPTLGLECSGIVRRIGEGVKGFSIGDPVIAFAASSFGNRVTTLAIAAARMPGGVSFEAGATIPSAFFTAYYALIQLAHLREGERILIHGAAGGVGIAAIQLAKWCGAEVFATAGQPEKRDFLKLMGVDHVFDSRSLEFADEILALTRGTGVDVVLNSLAGEAIGRNLRILRPFGRFLELGKRDFYENTKVGLRPFRNNISYFGIDADQLMGERPDLTAEMFGRVMDLFNQGVLHPLPYMAFCADDVVDAFRYMQQSKHIGKIVITYDDGIRDVAPVAPEISRLELPSSATYLVTGGLGGFGLETARWLISRGARNLVLVGRTGPSSAEARDSLAEFRRDGVKVDAVACDVTDEGAMASLFARIAAEMPPLRGVVHAAAVIEDGLIQNIERMQIARVLAPKILGAQHLHQMTLQMELDFFVLYSSATTLFGNPGQGSYVAANAYLDALAEARRAAGLPALCVRWGAIEDVGFLARNQRIKEALVQRIGGTAMHSGTALRVLEELLATNRSGLGVLDLDWPALRRSLPSAGSPKFSELVARDADSESDRGESKDFRSLIGTLPAAELDAACVTMLQTELGEILRMPADGIDVNQSMVDMGLDSLMAVELVVAIEVRFGVNVPVLKLGESPTIAELSQRILALVGVGGGIEGAGEESRVPPDLVSQVRQIAMVHATDVDADTVERIASQLQSDNPAPDYRMID